MPLKFIFKYSLSHLALLVSLSDGILKNGYFDFEHFKSNRVDFSFLLALDMTLFFCTAAAAIPLSPVLGRGDDILWLGITFNKSPLPAPLSLVWSGVGAGGDPESSNILTSMYIVFTIFGEGPYLPSTDGFKFQGSLLTKPPVFADT